MREHSRLELFRKLQKKDYVEGVDVEKLLDELEENNYLNEERFTESFIRYRASRGQGSGKISSELNSRGIKSQLISNALQNCDVNWFDLALEQLEKKFGKTKSQDYKEKCKKMRFLSSRGFSAEIIHSIVE
ncbi:UNVERIFIED_CONTAM: hypothetical protein GTU68_065347 [Idotea baltica]|nr:hypothetical protein [Idotea baltica]